MLTSPDDSKNAPAEVVAATGGPLPLDEKVDRPTSSYVKYHV